MSQRYPSSDNELVLFRVLQRANLGQYYDSFMSQGGDDVNQLCEAGEEEFLEIMALVGMASKPLHVRRLQKALLEWIIEPALFCRPMAQDSRRPSAVVTAKGSIYSALQQDPRLLTRTLNGTGSTSHVAAGSDSRGGVGRHLVTNHCGTPNSDETSEPDAPSSAGIDVSVSQGLALSPSSGSTVPVASLLSGEQIAAIAATTANVVKTLPSYAPKPLNVKKPVDKEIQEAMSVIELDPSRWDLVRKYSAIYGRFDSKRRPEKTMNFHEVCVNEAAAHLCRYQPSLLTRRDDLFNLALRIVKDTDFTTVHIAVSVVDGTSSGTGPASKVPRTDSPSLSSSPASVARCLTDALPEPDCNTASGNGPIVSSASSAVNDRQRTARSPCSGLTAMDVQHVDDSQSDDVCHVVDTDLSKSSNDGNHAT